MKKVLLLALVFVVCISSGCARVVQDGQAGVKFDFGKISKRALHSGLHWYIPLITKIERWNVKTKEIKETAQVPSSEGLISTLDVSVLFRTPIDKVVDIREKIGFDYVDVILVPNVRDAIRAVVSGYPVKALYSDVGRNEISTKILEKLQSKLENKGVVIEDVLLRDVRLPPTFSSSIEAKLKAEQESLQKEFELRKAEKDAEIEVARAKGVAESNKIIASSITEGYLRYLWIQGLQDGSSEVIYVPTEANLPILEAIRKQ